jgi:hypothetical protein
MAVTMSSPDLYGPFWVATTLIFVTAGEGLTTRATLWIRIVAGCHIDYVAIHRVLIPKGYKHNEEDRLCEATPQLGPRVASILGATKTDLGWTGFCGSFEAEVWHKDRRTCSGTGRCVVLGESAGNRIGGQRVLLAVY